MKKNLLLGLLSTILLVSCENYKNYKLDGMWQLKTIKDTNGKITQVDTVFYSFRREVVFSFTITENSQFASYPFYGYMDIPSGDKVHVLMHGISIDPDRIELFLLLSGWSSADITFDIINYTNTSLVLFDNENGKTFTLKKF